jgi:hypothetical protein
MATRPIFRLVAGLLVGIAAATLLTAPALALPGAHPVLPSGCHSHKAPATPPAPVDYQCGAAGHNAAMPGSGFTVQPPALVGETQAAKPAFFSGATSITIFTQHPRLDDSPGFDPLRI